MRVLSGIHGQSSVGSVSPITKKVTVSVSFGIVDEEN